MSDTTEHQEPDWAYLSQEIKSKWGVTALKNDVSIIAKTKKHLPEVSNMVEHPPHYTSGAVECIDAIESAVVGLDGGQAYLTGNIIKYLWRFKHKNGLQDLQKAEWYLRRLMEVQHEIESETT